eukprot:11813915-Karenia_brevis.AAC.1
MVFKFEPQKFYRDVTNYTGFDHAGRLKTRRSTAGIIMMLGNHCVKGASGVHSTIALSSSE